MNNYLRNLDEALKWYRSRGGGVGGVSPYGGGGEIVPGLLFAQGLAAQMGGNDGPGAPDFFDQSPANTLASRSAQQPPGPVAPMSPRAIEEASAMRARQPMNVLARRGGRF